VAHRDRRGARRWWWLLGGAALVAAGVVAWAVATGSPAPDLRRSRLIETTVASRAVGRTLPLTILVPPGAERGPRRPLLVLLHGHGGDERSFLARPIGEALARAGSRAPIVAMPDGGDGSYWHDRRDGAWGRYVVEEVIPQAVRRARADARRVGIGGISMGGFGAYDLARLHPGRFCAVGGHSPALWRTGGETAAGAFDDAADFARHDLVAVAEADREAFRAQSLWLDAGDRDPFRPGDLAFVAALRAAGAQLTVRTWPGGHDDDYWDRRFDAYMRFYVDALGRCRGRDPG
jgi:S-formylglutathione hydrolase FrmB